MQNQQKEIIMATFEFQVGIPSVIAGVTERKKSYVFNYPEQIDTFIQGLDHAKTLKGKMEVDHKGNLIPVFTNIMDLTSLDDAQAIKADFNELNVRQEGKPSLKTTIKAYKNDQGQERWLFGFRYNTDAEQKRRDERPLKRAELKARNAALGTSNVLKMTTPTAPKAEK
jgi:hypothetical protein